MAIRSFGVGYTKGRGVTEAADNTAAQIVSAQALVVDALAVPDLNTVTVTGAVDAVTAIGTALSAITTATGSVVIVVNTSGGTVNALNGAYAEVLAHIRSCGLLSEA